MPQSGEPSNATPRPVPAVRLRVGEIPKEIKQLDRWILWKYTWVVPKTKPGQPPKPGKWTKTPHSAKSGHAIDATNHANGVSFMDAAKALRTRKGTFDGLGFLLGNGIAGIDVDDCIDEDGNLDERGLRMSKAYAATYAEVSPSGQGFKVLVNIGDDPKLAAIGKNDGNAEIYGSKRYFTVTGNRLPNHAPGIAHMAEAFAGTAEEMGVGRNRPAPMPTDRPKEAVGIDLKAARELLDHLPFVWCDAYLEWLRAGMALHHEFGGSLEALELWDEWSQRNPARYQDGACQTKWETFGKPGKDEVTLRTLVRDAQASGWRAPHTIARAVQDFTPFDEQDDDDPAALNWWQKNSIGSMLTTPAPEKQWVWHGVLRQGKVMILGGSGGSSKSYLMLGAAVQYSLSNTWGPFVMQEGAQPGKALLLYGEEDREDIHDRVQNLRHSFMLTDEQIETVASNLAVLPLRGAHIDLARMDPQTNDVIITEHMERLEARIKEYQVKLVVMDPLALLHTLEENDNRAIAAFISGLDAVCMRTGCSIVLVHHFSKGGPMKAREVNESNLRGASALVAHARTVVVMHRMREDEAAEWGQQEDQAHRWVMWAIAKNNYGPTGQRVWFEVNSQNGSIAPSANPPVYLSPQAIRQMVNEAREEDAQSEFTMAQEREARATAEEAIAMQNRMRVLLRHAQREGKLPATSKAQDVLVAAGINCTPRRARATLEAIRDKDLVDTDGHVNIAGEQWLADREMLE